MVNIFTKKLVLGYRITYPDLDEWFLDVLSFKVLVICLCFLPLPE